MPPNCLIDSLGAFFLRVITDYIAHFAYHIEAINLIPTQTCISSADLSLAFFRCER